MSAGMMTANIPGRPQTDPGCADKRLALLAAPDPGAAVEPLSMAKLRGSPIKRPDAPKHRRSPDDPDERDDAHALRRRRHDEAMACGINAAVDT